ncbi:hypothetical protein [Hyphomonas sp.]|jgi:hypothetical protein|tara:strand:- start:6323 stop:6445 length:123 start_codon:yes stop_codon:yes gene_type:complete
MGRILGKFVVASVAFAAGITWGIVADAAEAGVPFSSLLGF